MISWTTDSTVKPARSRLRRTSGQSAPLPRPELDSHAVTSSEERRAITAVTLFVKGGRSHCGSFISTVMASPGGTVRWAEALGFLDKSLTCPTGTAASQIWTGAPPELVSR